MARELSCSSTGAPGAPQLTMPWLTSRGVRLLILDFDQTLSVVHVFKLLAGWDDGDQVGTVPGPHATTELGQMRRIRELDLSPEFEGGFASFAFGSEGRTVQLRKCLHMFREAGVELIVCSKGLVGAIKQCLKDVQMLELFSEIYGNIGCNAYGGTAYDRSTARLEPSREEDQLLGSAAAGSWSTKDKLIMRLMRKRRLKRDQVVLVEDDYDEIRRARSVCQTFWVKEAEGLTLQNLVALQRLVLAPAADSYGPKRLRGSPTSRETCAAARSPLTRMIASPPPTSATSSLLAAVSRPGASVSAAAAMASPRTVAVHGASGITPPSWALHSPPPRAQRSTGAAALLVSPRAVASMEPEWNSPAWSVGGSSSTSMCSPRADSTDAAMASSPQSQGPLRPSPKSRASRAFSTPVKNRTWSTTTPPSAVRRARRSVVSSLASSPSAERNI